MKRLYLILVFLTLSLLGFSKEYKVYGPQGGLAMEVMLPDGFNVDTDKCPMVILMHGIFSSKNFTPMPTIARSLAKEGIASIRFNFSGHWSSEGKMQLMTIENEIADAIAMWHYTTSLPYVTRIGLLGHSQGGVVASMTAGRIATMPTTAKPLYALALIAPATVLKNACQNGKLFDARFDPVNPPEYVKCFGLMKLGREYLLTTQQLDIYGTACAYHGPVLILHGKNDRLVPLWCSQQYLTTYPATTSQLTIIEGENHRISRKTKKVATLVTQFFKQH
jgi:pimeloyl-ACP methyl ester carboxylesterase